jgi:ribosomal-protein-alanine N-acetyltransferase
MMERKEITINDGRKVNIRPLIPHDKDQLVHLFNSMSPEILRWTHEVTLQQIDQKIRFPDYHISLITEHMGRVIGYGEIQKGPQKKNGELNIHLNQDYHGVGLGTAMMIMLLKDASEQQLQEIHLQVAADNRAAVRLFRKFGFRHQKTTQEKYGEKELDTLYMTKTINK